MNKKTLILNICLSFIFIVLITVSILFLYKEQLFEFQFNSIPLNCCKIEETQVSTGIKEDTKNIEIKINNGPFEVTNSLNFKKNTLTQNSDLSISLINEHNKKLWTKALNSPICGRVEEVDFYNNKKIQFLFATYNKVYLLDRLSRLVKGFPINLEKDIILGPKLFKINGKYSFMVLNKDNSLSYYNLSGGKVKNFKDINIENQIITELPNFIPEKQAWKIQTNQGEYLFSFDGKNQL